jgi:hypothetical protein
MVNLPLTESDDPQIMECGGTGVGPAAARRSRRCNARRLFLFGIAVSSQDAMTFQAARIAPSTPATIPLSSVTGLVEI